MAAIAFANKIARMVWAMMTTGERYSNRIKRRKIIGYIVSIAEHAGKAAIDHSMATMLASKCPTSTRSPIFLPMQSWPIQLHRLRINAGGPSKFRKGRFQFS